MQMMGLGQVETSQSSLFKKTDLAIFFEQNLHGLL
jgi:hypothetical protein